MRWAVLTAMLTLGCAEVAEGLYPSSHPAESAPVATPTPQARPRPPECHGETVDDRVISIRCTAWGAGTAWGPADDQRAIGAAFVVAAQSTIQAGKTHFISTSSDDLKSAVQIHRDPLICDTHEAGTAIDTPLGLGGAGNGAGACVIGGDNCAPPPPPRRVVRTCTGGEVWGVHSYSFEYRALTLEEAAERRSDLLPPEKRPFDAHAFLSARMPSTPVAGSSNVPAAPPTVSAPRDAQRPNENTHPNCPDGNGSYEHCE